jgi:hypothetical protein
VFLLELFLHSITSVHEVAHVDLVECR